MGKLIRNCPKCGLEIKYSNKYRKTYSEKHKMVCAKCAHLMRIEKYGDNLKKIHEEIHEGKRINGFQDKKHSNETLKKMSYSRKDMGVYKTKEYKEKMSKLTKGENNPMYGRSIFDVWVEKYGVDEANKRNEIRKQKVSMKVKGKNNPMYGKPTPLKAGNGVSGWYKNFYFRSLHELQFILVCERFKLNIISAEKIRIDYISYTGNERTYSPDYIVNDELLVEVKPKKLHNTPLNKLKFEAAKIYSIKNNLKFKIIDLGLPNQNQIDKLITNQSI